MCIIIAKPAGADLPNEETFDNCFTSNKDGIGFSFAMPGETVHIAKGYVNVKKLMKMLSTYNITKKHNLIVHFRYATHGKKDPGNCHPFPLSQSFDDMRLLNCTCGTSIAHNGVFSGMPASKDHSDTMKFIGGILAQPEIIDNLDSKAVKELIRGYCGYSSKLAFLSPQGINLIGDFETSEGVYYSNNQFKKGATRWLNDDAYDYGTSWCHVHKVKDDCSYCREHGTWDDCAKNKIKGWKDRFMDSQKNKILEIEHQCCDIDLRNICLWCKGNEKVVFDEEVDGFLCENCSLLYSGQARNY
jgi:hypothetical protein